MRRSTLTILAITVAATALDAAAQRMPGRDRGDSPRGESRRDRDAPKARPAEAGDPFAALERELPSLATDLRLTKEQVGPWAAFERDVRDAAELERSRRKHLAAFRDAVDRPGAAGTLLASLAEDARLKAEAAADMKRDLESLWGLLDEGQKRLVDRRLVQSQLEPLGR